MEQMLIVLFMAFPVKQIVFQRPHQLAQCLGGGRCAVILGRTLERKTCWLLLLLLRLIYLEVSPKVFLAHLPNFIL